MVVVALGKSLQHISWSWRHLPITFSALSSVSHLSTYRMSSSADFARLHARAETTDKILADLEAQIEVIKRNAVKQAGLVEEEQLILENEKLKKEIESVRRDLILAEIGNGVRQVPAPTKGTLSAITSSVNTKPAPSSPPLVNGTAPDSSNKSKAKEIKEVSEKKTKQADQPDVGGKKIKIDKGKEGKVEGGAGKSKKAATAGSGDDGGDGLMDVSRLDFRVGKIVAVEKHPDADTLYVEKVDLGEGHNRTVVSGLVKHFPVNAMKDRIAVFMCNLKPSKIRGILSEAMIMCAVGPEKTEILVPPTDSVIGDRIIVGEYPGTPDEQLNPKKKIWETLKPDIRTNKDRIATYKGAHWTIPGKGVVAAPTLGDTQIS